MLGQLGDGDGRVIHHTCSSNKNKKDPPRGGKERESVSKAEKELENNWGFAANITMEHELSAWEACEEHSEFHTKKKKQ